MGIYDITMGTYVPKIGKYVPKMGTYITEIDTHVSKMGMCVSKMGTVSMGWALMQSRGEGHMCLWKGNLDFWTITIVLEK